MKTFRDRSRYSSDGKLLDLFLIFILATIIGWSAGCIGTKKAEAVTDNTVYPLDFQMPGKVINKWHSAGMKVVSVQFHYQNHTFNREFTEPYFGNLDPKWGDCVNVWVRQSEKDGWFAVMTERDLEACLGDPAGK